MKKLLMIITGTLVSVNLSMSQQRPINRREGTPPCKSYAKPPTSKPIPNKSINSKNVPKDSLQDNRCDSLDIDSVKHFSNF